MAEPVPAKEPSADGTVFGVALLVVGGGWLAQAAGLTSLTWPALLSAGLVGLGAALVFTARRSTTKLPVLAGVIMAGVLAATTATVNLDAGVLRGGAGDRFYQPTSVAALDTEFTTAAGTLTVDLRSLDLTEGTHDVRATLGVGDLRVIVPRGTAVYVRATVGMGEINIFGREQVEGFNTTRSYRDPGFEQATKRLDIRVGAGAGEIKVERAG